MSIMSRIRTRGTAYVMAMLLLTLAACSSSILGPEDSDYEEFCAVYMSEADAAHLAETLRRLLTPEQIRRCRPINVYIVKFGG